MKTPSGNIRTYSGLLFPVFEATADLIRPIDIAHGLAFECRWQGMCNRLFSVAEHSIWVAKMSKEIARHRRLNETEAAVYALLHDAHEAYLSDIPKPLKDRFPEVKIAAERIDRCILEAFKLPEPSAEIKQVVHLADEYSAWVESRALFEIPEGDTWEPGTRPDPDCVNARDMYYDIRVDRSPFVIRDAWLSVFGHYVKHVNPVT